MTGNLHHSGLPPLARATRRFLIALAVCLAFAAGPLAGSVEAQSFDSSAPPQLASSAERLMMEQVAELSRAEQFEEALASLQKLYDQGAGSLVDAGRIEHLATQRLQRYIPLRQWCQEKTYEILAGQPALRAGYVRQVDGLAAAALASLQATKDPLEANKVSERYRLSSLGDELAFFLADLYLERGWSLAAVAAVEEVTPELRYRLPTEGSTTEGSTTGRASWPWWHLRARAADAEARQRLLTAWREQAAGGAPGPIDNPRLLEALKRLLVAAAMQPEAMDRLAIEAWVRDVAPELAQPLRTELLEAVAEAKQWPSWPVDRQWTTFAANSARAPRCAGKYDLSAWPAWQQQLERYTASSDRTAASQPRVGESSRGTLPYHPVVADGKVFVHELTRIRAYDLESGKPWPGAAPSLPVFDSQISSAAYVPLGYPLVGAVRGSLALVDDFLYARMGSPITGWNNREAAADGGSLSYLVGLDLKKQGSLLRGFPLRLTEPEFTGAEFEGCPLVWGELLLAPIVERDNVGLRRSIVAFDRFSGEQVWRSAVLAAGTVEGSDRANLITHQLLTFAGGRLFYNTNLGSIVCLDPLTGATEWLVRYQRHDQQKRPYPTPERFRYRDLTPCLVAQGMVICMPQDCAELFALDATTGDLLWSTDGSEVVDAIHLIGVSGGSLVVSGDRLLWLDRCSGKVLDRFPGSTTPGRVNALPSPRGLGRGVISEGEVYWPTAGEVFVFDADISQRHSTGPPPIRRRHRLDSRGGEGGNLTIAEGYLIYCGPGRILVFKSN